MSRTQAVGVLLIALGVIYALMYLGWVRRARRHQSAAIATTPRPAPPASTPVATYHLDAPSPEAAPAEAQPTEELPLGQFELPIALDTWAEVEGTYVSTTVALSRHERVSAAGLGARAEATMVVDAAGVRWDRQGAVPVHVDGHLVTGVRTDRGMAGKFVGQPRIVVVAWRAPDGAIFETGFLPRYKADIEPLLAAVERLNDQHPTAPDGDK